MSDERKYLVEMPETWFTHQNNEACSPWCVSEMRDKMQDKIDSLTVAIERMDVLAEAGLCQFTSSGKHSFLNDIRRVAAELGIQGGLTSYGS